MRRAPRKWDEQAIRAEAANHQSRRALEAAAGGAVRVARARYPGLLDELFPRKQAVPFTLESAMALGRTFKRRSEFMRGASAAYSHCSKAGVLGALGFDDSTWGKSRLKWVESAVREEAKRYENKRSFERHSRGASEAARRLGIIDDLGLKAYPPSDNDTIYIWRAVGQHYNGNPVYKIGVTSTRLGTLRVEQVAKGSGFDFDLICCEPVQCKASNLEAKLLILGENPGYTGFNGAAEFRALSDSALYAAVSMICNQL